MNENAYQPLPRLGVLARNLNLNREDLRKRLASNMDDTVYYYVVDTVEYENGRLYQTGSGPNFQGGLVTLCSCKHKMRTYPLMAPGLWVAGFTNVSVLGRNSLFYLMKVGETFSSHSEYWNSQTVPEEAKTAKAADAERFGDIYRPRGDSEPLYSPSGYFEPCRNHVHCEAGNWMKDINYDQKGRRPKLLMGDPEYSFLWDRIRISFPKGQPIGRGERKCNLSAII